MINWFSKKKIQINNKFSKISIENHAIFKKGILKIKDRDFASEKELSFSLLI